MRIRMVLLTLMGMVLMCSGCSREQVLSNAASLEDAHEKSTKDTMVKGFRAKVSDAPRCRSFKDRFQAVGQRHVGATSGAFHVAMGETWEEVKKAGCTI